MAVEMSIPWPASLPQLKRLDELLRCGICYEFMTTSVVTLCSHNYCSLCIRQYLQYKTQCPACFKETTDQHLRTNRLVDEIIALFPNLRDKVARLCQTSKGGVITGYLDSREEGTEGSSRDLRASEAPQTTVSVCTTPSKQLHQLETGTYYCKAVTAASPRKSLKDFFTSPKKEVSGSNHQRSSGGGRLSVPPVSGSSKLLRPSPSTTKPEPTASTSASPAGPSASGYFSIRSSGSSKVVGATGSSEPEEVKVSCPVCDVKVPERNINLHLDSCLQRIEEGDIVEIPTNTPKRKPLPKLVYSLLQEKQLRQKLKEIGLPCHGDKTVLASRHRRYTMLYNAECDLVEPRPVAELVRQVEQEERNKSKTTISKSIFTFDRKTAPEIIEEKQKEYLKKHNDHFAQLIADVKKRRLQSKMESIIPESEMNEVKKEKFDTKDKNNGPKKSRISNKIPQAKEKIIDAKNISSDSEGNCSFHGFQNGEFDKENIGMPTSFKFSPLKNKHSYYTGSKVNTSASAATSLNGGKNESITNNAQLHNFINGNIDTSNSVDEKKGDDSLLPSTQASQNKKEAYQKETCSEDCAMSSQRPNKDSQDFVNSPTLFSLSPASSNGSNESISLLQDSESLPPEMYTNAMSDGEEDEETIPPHQPAHYRSKEAKVVMEEEEAEEPSSAHKLPDESSHDAFGVADTQLLEPSPIGSLDSHIHDRPQRTVAADLLDDEAERKESVITNDVAGTKVTTNETSCSKVQHNSDMETSEAGESSNVEKINPNVAASTKDDQEMNELSPPVTPPIKRKIKKRNQPQLSCLRNLDAETQLLVGDTPQDPDYFPSQSLDDELDFPAACRPKRSSRKRQLCEEQPHQQQQQQQQPSLSRNRRRKKKQ